MPISDSPFHVTLQKLRVHVARGVFQESRNPSTSSPSSKLGADALRNSKDE